MSFSSVEKFPRIVRVIDAVTFPTVKGRLISQEV